MPHVRHCDEIDPTPTPGAHRWGDGVWGANRGHVCVCVSELLGREMGWRGSGPAEVLVGFTSPAQSSCLPAALSVHQGAAHNCMLIMLSPRVYVVMWQLARAVMHPLTRTQSHKQAHTHTHIHTNKQTNKQTNKHERLPYQHLPCRALLYLICCSGASVLSGITLTKLVGVVVLATAKTRIFQVYYFRSVTKGHAHIHTHS